MSIAGRMMLKRVQGKASFATIQDGTGRIQLWINDEGVGAGAHDAFKHWDLGDIVAAEGTLFKTMKGELSVRCSSVRLLAKSLRPLPEKFHGLADLETRYRQRYVDLITNEDSRRVFEARSRILSAIRGFMSDTRFPRSRDADAAADSRWRRGPAVRHPSQRARPGDVPADRARALPEAAGRRRLRAGFRDQPQLPQRGTEPTPQSRVHDDGVLRRVHRLLVVDGLHRGRCCARQHAPPAARSSSTRAPTSTCRSRSRG